MILPKATATVILGTLCQIFFGCKTSQNYSVSPGESSQKIYFFNSLEPFKATLEGSFSKHVPPTPGETIPGEFDDFPASLTYVSHESQLTTLRGTARLRGQASLTVCTFPKLEFHLREKASLSSSPFLYDNKVKIGTHCAEGESIAIPVAIEFAKSC